MVTMGFPVKKEQPFITEITVDAKTGGRLGSQTTIWLEPVVTTHDGQELPASRFGIAWQNLPQWVKENPGHPFIYAYTGVMARQHIVQNIVHNTISLTIRSGSKFVTDDLTLASALHGSGCKCLGKTADKRFVFPKTQALKLHVEYLKPATANTAIQWMKLAVTNYHLLNEAIKMPANVPVITRKRVVDGKLRVLQLPVNMSDDTRRTFESYFYGDEE